MILQSKCKELGAIEFPRFNNIRIYMEPISLDFTAISHSVNPNFGEYAPIVLNLLEKLPIKTGNAYLTIDEKLIHAGESHRRGGPHVDGNYIFSWGGGGGWLTGCDGRYLPLDKHRLQYCADKGGMLIASTYSACKGWLGEFSDEPEQGGNCSHIDTSSLKEIMLDANKLYWGNSTFIHESLPVAENVYRQLIRITLPADSPDL